MHTPGRLVQSACLDPLKLSVSEVARVLGASRPTLSSLINGRAALSAEMAIRLEKAFGSTADAWVRMQAAHDLARARRGARRVLAAFRRGIDLLQFSPYSCRKITSELPRHRELLVPFGSAGYVVLIEIEPPGTVTILAARHQREDDYH